VRADEVLDEDEHGGSPAHGGIIELVGEGAVRDDTANGECELPLNTEKNVSLVESLVFVRVDGGESISSCGEAVCGSRADGCGNVVRAGAERAASIGSGRGGSGRLRRRRDGGWRGGIEHAVGWRTEGERVRVECVVACGGFETAKAVEANGSSAPGRRCGVARAAASIGAPGSESMMPGTSASNGYEPASPEPEASAGGESMMSGGSVSSREGPASPEPEPSARGGSAKCGGMLSCDERLPVGVEAIAEKTGPARGVGLPAADVRARRRSTISWRLKISFPAWWRGGVATLRMAWSTAASAGDAA